MKSKLSLVLYGVNNFKNYRPERSYKFKEGEEPKTKISKRAIMIELGKVSNAFENVSEVLEHGEEVAAEEAYKDMGALVRYAIVLEKASTVEGGLDYKKAKEVLGVKEILKKYKSINKEVWVVS